MKKYVLSLLLASCLPGNAAILEFHLSPAGTDVATGLSPLNEVPPPFVSDASGTESPGSVYFDTEASTLSFAFAYDHLSTPLTGVGIYGPAPTGQNAGQIFNLAPYHAAAGLAFDAGMVQGTVSYPPAAVSDLLEGLHYINISSGVFPNGELRAQLIPVLKRNSTTTIAFVGEPSFACGEPGTATVSLDDPDGDPLVVVWEWNGWAVQTNLIAAGSVPCSVSFTAELPLGESVLSVHATDPDGTEAVCSSTIKVLDKTRPVIQSVVSDRTVLWPPNHRMVPVALEASVADACGSTVWGLVSVNSNEPDNSTGDGNSSSEWEILDDHTVLLRAERSGNGTGRIYTLGVQAIDAADNLSDPYYLEVTVPR